MIKSNVKSNLYYEIKGREDAPWIILLHGISGSSNSWTPQVKAFEKHFHILNLDLTGHGNSPSLDTKKYCGSIAANQIRILMDDLNIEKAHFLGISLGTVIEQYFAALFPERVLSLSFASPVCKSNFFTTIYNNFIDKIFLNIFSKNTYAKIISYLSLPGKSHKKSRMYFIRETKRMDNNEFRKWWKLILEASHLDYTPPCDIPTLIVAGKKDFWFFGNSVHLSKRYTNNLFHVYYDEGHVFIFRKKQDFNNMIIRFINNYNSINKISDINNFEINKKNSYNKMASAATITVTK